MISLGTSDTGAVVYYLRAGHFGHTGCSESAQVQVCVRLTGVEEPTIESVESWSCEACGWTDAVRNYDEHSTLADALRRLPPPPPGELGVDDLATQMYMDMAQARSEHAAMTPEG